MRDRGRAGAIVAVLVLLIGAGLPAAHPGASLGPSVGTSGVTNGVAVSERSDAVPAPAGPSTGSLNCSLLRAEFSELYEGLAVPPGVPGATFGGCPIGADDAGISFLSNASGSAANVSLSLVIPPAGGDAGSTYAMFSVRLAVSGVPCSLGGVSVLEVELVPPQSPYSGTPGSNWSIRTPAFDLAPAGACDPYCSNDTGLVTLDGASLCEDEVLPPSFVPAPGSGIAPGSSLTVSFRGTVGGDAGLSLWVNDTSDPNASVLRTFSAAATDLGRPLEPLYASAGLGRDLWDGTGPVALVGTDCPLPAGPTEACDSYDPAANGVGATVALTNVTYTGSSGGPEELYPEVATSSSSDACAAATPACPGFSEGDGSVYPTWGLAQVAGSLALGLASGPTSRPQFLGGAAGQFAGGGSAAFVPLRVIVAPITATPPSTTVSSTVLDLAGLSNLTYEPYYCSASTTPTELTVPGTRVAGSATDGSWNATFPVGSYAGTFPVAYSWYSSNGTPSFGGELTSFQGPGGPACVFPPPPAPTIDNVTAAALGYRVTWNDSGPALVGFDVNTTGPSAGAGVFVPETWAGTRNGTVSALLPLESSGATASVAVTAVGLAPVVAPSPNVTGPLPLAALSVSVTASPDPIVGPSRQVTVGVQIAGGLAPYSYSINLGDGTPSIDGLLGGNGSFPVALGPYLGVLDIAVNVTDAAGDVVAAVPLLVPIWGNPLGVPQSSEAGDGFVTLSWGTPGQPGGPLVGYFIYSTTNVSDVWRLASAGVVPGTFDGIHVSYTVNHTLAFMVADGSALFAQVVGLSATGLGLLPAGNATLVGRPAPFVVGPILTVGGGVAPFTDNFTASVSGGSNDSLLSAVFSFPGFVVVDATIAGGNGSFLVNASYTFLTPGTFPVTLHVTDDEYDVGLVSTTVFVAPGVPPALTAAVLNAPAYNGTPVQFQAVATGGSGDDAFNWSFGDGSYANGSNPIHVYAEPGTYSAVVRATDVLTEGYNVTTFPVTVFTDPVVFISVFPGPNGTDSFDFRASVGGGSGPSLILWSFGDGTLGHGANVTHDYDTPGTYTVNVTATDPAGHAGTTQYLLVAQAPTSTGGGGGSGGVSPTLFWLVVVIAAGVILVAILIAVRRPPPTPAVPVGEFEEEDGAVSLS